MVEVITPFNPEKQLILDAATAMVMEDGCVNAILVEVVHDLESVTIMVYTPAVRLEMEVGLPGSVPVGATQVKL